MWQRQGTATGAQERTVEQGLRRGSGSRSFRLAGRKADAFDAERDILWPQPRRLLITRVRKLHAK
jgi:hypothetical protein